MDTEPSSITETLKFKEELKAGLDDIKERIRLIEQALLKRNIYSKKCIETIRKICDEEGTLTQDDFRQICSKRYCLDDSEDDECLLKILWEKTASQLKRKCNAIEEILSNDVSNGDIVDFLNQEVLRLMGRRLAHIIYIAIGNASDKGGEILDIYFWPGYQSIWMEKYSQRTNRITLMDEDPEDPSKPVGAGIGIRFEKDGGHDGREYYNSTANLMYDRLWLRYHEDTLKNGTDFIPGGTHNWLTSGNINLVIKDKDMIKKIGLNIIEVSILEDNQVKSEFYNIKKNYYYLSINLRKSRAKEWGSNIAEVLNDPRIVDSAPSDIYWPYPIETDKGRDPVIQDLRQKLYSYWIASWAGPDLQNGDWVSLFRKEFNENGLTHLVQRIEKNRKYLEDKDNKHKYSHWYTISLGKSIVAGRNIENPEELEHLGTIMLCSSHSIDPNVLSNIRDWVTQIYLMLRNIENVLWAERITGEMVAEKVRADDAEREWNKERAIIHTLKSLHARLAVYVELGDKTSRILAKVISSSLGFSFEWRQYASYDPIEKNQCSYVDFIGFLESLLVQVITVYCIDIKDRIDDFESIGNYICNYIDYYHGSVSLGLEREIFEGLFFLSPEEKMKSFFKELNAIEHYFSFLGLANAPSTLLIKVNVSNSKSKFYALMITFYELLKNTISAGGSNKSLIIYYIKNDDLHQLIFAEDKLNEAINDEAFLKKFQDVGKYLEQNNKKGFGLKSIEHYLSKHNCGFQVFDYDGNFLRLITVPEESNLFQFD